MNFAVWRTSANELSVLCESSGWSLQPLVSLLDARSADVPAAQKKVSVRPDGLFAVTALVNLAAVEGKHEHETKRSQVKTEINIPEEFDPHCSTHCETVWCPDDEKFEFNI